MKILHKSKRAAAPHQQVAELVLKISNTSKEDLADVLSEIDAWQWPRSDLNAWIKVLNKFDGMLEQAIAEYEVDKLQRKEFSPLTKRIVCEILRFERLLLENSTNRKMYNSYDRLNSLLFTSDLDVLGLALNLLLRPSQQYSAQPAVSQALNISTSRLSSLAKRWPSLREYGVGLVELVNPGSRAEVEGLPSEAREVNYSFYRLADKPTEKDGNKMEPEVVESAPSSSRKAGPAAASNAGSRLVNIHIDERTLLSKEPMEILAEAIDKYALPDAEKFEILCRIRSASALSIGREVDREKLVVVRLLAIAIFGHTHDEAQATSSLFLHEPDLIVHVAELLQLGRGISFTVQTAAIAALDALARYRNRVQEVLTAVNAGVNHGILMALVRRTVTEVADSDSSIPQPFVEALLSFVTFLATHAAGGNMVVGAGLIPLLIQVIENKLPQRLAVVSKTMQLVDNVLYSFSNAFQLFANARGVEVLVDRIEYEVDFNIKEYAHEQRSREMYGSYGDLPVARAAVMKHTLRSLHRMMQSSGTAEGLRGLIDTSILKSVKKVIEYRGLFGPSVLHIAINIMSTFVHNEPTSLTVIQESGLPEAFYKAIVSGLEPSIEILQSIPNAIGALCLNQVGQDQLAARPTIIPEIIGVLTSERHLKVLHEKENAVLIGTAIDELIRHHPSLKTPVFDSLVSTLNTIEDLGNTYKAPEHLRHLYHLVPVPASASDDDVTMQDGEPDRAENTTVDNEHNDAASEDTEKPNIVVSFMDVTCRFLEGLFQHTQHCKDFLSQTDGLSRLGRLTGSPCLSYGFSSSVAQDSLVQVMRTMADANAIQTVQYLLNSVELSLNDTRDFWENRDEHSKLFPLLDIAGDQAEDADRQFRNLVTLHIRITLLSDVFATSSYAHGRPNTQLFPILAGPTVTKIMQDLGSLHRAGIWENVVLKAALASRGIDVMSTPDNSPPDRSPVRGSVPLPEPIAPLHNGIGPEYSPPAVEANAPGETTAPVKSDGPRERMAKALKHLTHGLPSSLAPFFQAIAKMFYMRRTPDASQRKQIFDIADTVADVMLKHLTATISGGDKLSHYACQSVMLGLATLLLVDERTSQSTIHTVLLAAFYRAGGFDAIASVCRQFTSTIDSLYDVQLEERPDEATRELVHAYGGLKVALHLISHLIAPKPLFDSGQTLLAISRDKQDTDPDYFEPHNFLVRLRLTLLPLLREIWDSPWLVRAPLAMCRSVVQVVMELIGADGEEPKAESTEAAGNPSRDHPAVVVPDEDRIRQLTDMGFNRALAERALIRARNNVNSATELLLSQPIPFPAPSDEYSEDGTEAASASADESAPAPVESQVETQAPTVVQSEDDAPASSQPPSNVKTTETWRTALHEAREPLKANICPQALRLVDEHPALMFDLHSAFIRPTDAYQKQAVMSLVDDIKALSPSAYDAQQQQLANRCRLLALVLKETPSSLTAEVRAGLMNILLALPPSDALDVNPEHPVIPKWMAAHLLVVEAILTIGDQPSPVTLPKENESIVDVDLTVTSTFPQARTQLFELCLRLLASRDLPSDEFISVLRLLVLLTRDHHLALQFAERNGAILLFTRLKASPVPAGNSYVAIILRHVVEDPSTLRTIMQQSLKRYFAQPRTRTVDVGTHVRNCSMMALRDSSVFIDVTRSICQLSQPFSTPHLISLKPDKAATDMAAEETANNEADHARMQVESSQSKNDLIPSNKPLERIIHFLISDLMKSVKPIAERQTESAPNDSSKMLGGAEATPDIADEAINQHGREGDIPQDPFTYSCLLMQILTEMLFSYESCKLAFLSYSPRKRLASSSKEAPAKHRTAGLHFLLSELVAFKTINIDSNHEPRNQDCLANWAMSVILALCVDTSSTNELKDVSPDLVSIRKFVLEALNRAIKDAPSSESVDARYGRLLALSELCYRMLTARSNGPGRKSASDEIPTHIAKVMLEKNFVATLTNALAEVDLNYPNVKTLIVSILRPLEYLSKVAIKMSRASSKVKEPDGSKLDTASSISSGGDDDVRETLREDTPNLYSTSALGMYGGEMEDVNFSAQDEMDNDEQDENADVDMEYDDATGSEDTSEDEDSEGEGELEGEPRDSDSEEGWQDDDDEDEENLVENDEENDEDDEDEEDEDADQEAEDGIMWQGIVDGGNVNADGAEAGDEDDEAEVQIPIVRTDSENERDALSEDEDIVHDLSVLDGTDGARQTTEDLFGFSATFTNGLVDNGSRDGGAFFLRPFSSRRQATADNNARLWGRPRNGAGPSPEVTTHPLLLDANTSSNPAAGQSRGHRRAHRTIVAGGTTDLLQTIEDLLSGEGAVQLFQHFISRGVGGPEAIRVDVPASTFLDLQRQLGRVVTTSLRVERAARSGETRNENRDLDPLFTLQRWAEEVKILHGQFVNERVDVLANHVVLALMPAAMELRKKMLEEQELAKARELKQKEEAESAAEARSDAAPTHEGASQADAETATTVDAPDIAVDVPNPPASATPTADPALDPVSGLSTETNPLATALDAATSDVHGEATSGDGAQASTSDGSASSARTRITVLIHGSEVDITDTGIDPTFLEALPDDMREEVLNQHVRDQRAARVERPPDSQISAEFLDALPPELRAEIIQQERQEQARRDRDARAQPTGVPAEIDAASFIASLDPQLREVVLMDQDDGFIQTLPSHMIAEVGSYRDDSRARRPHASHSAPRAAPLRPAARKGSVAHDAIQLLDKYGIAVLVRLLFFPQVLKKTLLFKLLVNLCENAKSRTELFNLLLNILQDGTGDLAAVDKSFSQMSVRNSKSPSAQLPRTIGKQKASSDYFNGLNLPTVQHDAAPEVVAQRCLEALTFIVGANESSSTFFLTEHELPAGLRRAASKKGKGKERQAPQTHYPIVLLLGLLDRRSLVKTPSIMEAVVCLLATVTRPLTSLKDSANGHDSAAAASSLTSPPVATSTVAVGSILGGTGSHTSDPSALLPPVPPGIAGSVEHTRAPVQLESQPSSTPQVSPITTYMLTTESVSAPAQPAPEPAVVLPNDAGLLAHPPQIPHSALRLIVNILTVGECSGRTFQQSLALIQHLSHIPDARDVIAFELKSKAQEFGQIMYTDLDELVAALQRSSNEPLISSVASKFSTPSSEQARLLRVLKTIDYMYSTRTTAESVHTAADIEKVQGIYESFQFAPLWRRLGDCLAVIEEKPETEHIATVLLPLIETLMVVCKYVASKPTTSASTRAIRSSASPRSPTSARESMEDLFVTFTDAHRKVLNLMVRNNPSLMSGSFSLLVHNPRVLDFDNKRNYFTQQLHRRHNREHHPTLQLNVRRARVFEDSFQYLQRKTGEQIKYGKLSIRFYDEEGVDAGGVTREWFQILARQMFDPNNALFQPCAADRLTYQPNKNSWVNPEHLSFFKFVGRIIGKAIYDGRLLDAYFARSLYRQLLGKPVDYRDVEWVDPEYYNSLCWILENDPTVLELNFSVEADEFGINRIIELKEGGASIPVTQESKREFVQLSAQYRLYSSIKDQIESLLAGFYEIVPKDLVTIFNEQEIELLISGTPDIDVDEWRAATEYNGYTSSDPVIVWWWRALKSFTRDERAKVLSFATGTSRVPLNGFVDLQGVQGVQRFSIHRAYGDSNRLPQAHTCFNQIDLPQYTSYEMLRQQLLLAIEEGSEGFGFA